MRVSSAGCGARLTRLDISFDVGYVSKIMEYLREDQWAAVRQLLCYVKGMTDQGAVFPQDWRIWATAQMF